MVVDHLPEKLLLELLQSCSKKVLENKLGKKFKISGAVTQLGIIGCDTSKWNDKIISKNPFFCPDKSMLKIWEKIFIKY